MHPLQLLSTSLRSKRSKRVVRVTIVFIHPGNWILDIHRTIHLLLVVTRILIAGQSRPASPALRLPAPFSLRVRRPRDRRHRIFFILVRSIFSSFVNSVDRVRRAWFTHAHATTRLGREHTAQPTAYALTVKIISKQVILVKEKQGHILARLIFACTHTTSYLAIPAEMARHLRGCLLLRAQLQTFTSSSTFCIVS